MPNRTKRLFDFKDSNRVCSVASLVDRIWHKHRAPGAIPTASSESIRLFSMRWAHAKECDYVHACISLSAALSGIRGIKQDSMWGCDPTKIRLLIGRIGDLDPNSWAWNADWKSSRSWLSLSTSQLQTRKDQDLRKICTTVMWMRARSTKTHVRSVCMRFSSFCIFDIQIIFRTEKGHISDMPRNHSVVWFKNNCLALSWIWIRRRAFRAKKNVNYVFRLHSWDQI